MTAKKRAKRRGPQEFTIAGERVLIESGGMFGGENVNIIRDRSLPHPESGELIPAMYFLGRVGSEWVGSEHLDGVWRGEGFGWVKGQFKGRTKEEVIEQMVLAFQREQPRVS